MAGLPGGSTQERHAGCDDDAADMAVVPQRDSIAAPGAINAKSVSMRRGAIASEYGFGTHSYLAAFVLISNWHCQSVHAGLKLHVVSCPCQRMHRSGCHKKTATAHWHFSWRLNVEHFSAVQTIRVTVATAHVQCVTAQHCFQVLLGERLPKK